MNETPLLDALLARVRVACAASDQMKGEIAQDLGMPASRFSEYLSRKYKPNGETTLRLLKWVEAEENRRG